MSVFRKLTVNLST